MKYIKIFISVSLITLLFACENNKAKKDSKKETEELVNILEQSDDYIGKFKVPSSKDVEEGSALSIVTSINENVDKIEIAEKISCDDTSVLESYKVDCYGVGIEIRHYQENSTKLNEIRENGKITYTSAKGKILAEHTAVTNGNYALIFLSQTNSSGDDCSEKNNEIIEKFKSLELK